MPLRADVPRGDAAGNPIRPPTASSSPCGVSLWGHDRGSCWFAGVGRVSASAFPSGSRRQRRLGQFSCVALRMADRHRPVGSASPASGTTHNAPSGPVGNCSVCNAALSSSPRLLLNPVDGLHIAFSTCDVVIGDREGKSFLNGPAIANPPPDCSVSDIEFSCP
jgi:hypothetical protein